MSTSILVLKIFILVKIRVVRKIRSLSHSSLYSILYRPTRDSRNLLPLLARLKPTSSSSSA